MPEDLIPTLALIDLLSAEPLLKEYEASLIVWQVLKAAGYAVSDPTKGERGTPIDLQFTGQLEGVREKIGVEIKAHRGHVSGQTIYKALEARSRGGFDRMLVIALGQFSPLALERVETDRLGKVDLLTPKDLRNWIVHRALAVAQSKSVPVIFRDAMREAALRLAHAPEELNAMEWRDLERMLREVFEGLGFETELTRAAKDGGFDLRLTADEATYLVEVKHWIGQKVGPAAARKLQMVASEEKAAGGVILASGGFTQTLFECVLEIGPPINLGGGSKILDLCKAYYRSGTPLWRQDVDLSALLLDGTVAVSTGACA